MGGIDDVRAERLKKIEILKSHGMEAYPARSDRTISNKEFLDRFEELATAKKEETLSGRIMSLRGQGGIAFADLFDGTARVQALIKKDEIGDAAFTLFEDTVDASDFIEVRGIAFTTNRGVKSILGKEWRMLAKSLRPVPDAWYGLKDEDERYRKRYLDILLNPDLRNLIEKKAKFWSVIRSFLVKEGFIEVETPTLELTTGGAEARPFATHHHDFDINVYLRISVGELWQKRLLAAGLPKTFEIGRVYRNEGTDQNHVQEFTNCEWYWAYANYEDGMKLIERLYQTIAREVFGTMKFNTRGYDVDFEGTWPVIDYTTEIKRRTGIDVLTATEDAIKQKLVELKVTYVGETRERLVDTLWKYCRKDIAGPAFVTGQPKLVSPLSKSRADNPQLTERFQVILAGSEMGNGYSELNNPLEQAARFAEQQALIERGDEEAMMPDHEFVEMLEYGMPPACGWGFGESVFAVMSGKPIRETQLFPLMKPR